MRILIVNVVYAKGSTGKIVMDLAKGLQKKGDDVLVCYSRGQKSNERDVVKLAPEYLAKFQSLLGKITGKPYDYCRFGTTKLFKLILNWKPSIVNLHCINGSTINIAETLTFLKNNHITTIVTCHAEFLYTGGCAHAIKCEKWKNGCHSCPQFKDKETQLPESWFFCKTDMYWKSLKNAYNGFGDKLKITCVSNWLSDRAKQSPFFSESQIATVLNGVNTNIFHRHNDKIISLKKELGIINKKIILHVTPDFYSTIKGGKYVLDIAKRLQNNPEIYILIIGYNGSGKDLSNNIIPINNIKNQEKLANYYSMADITLLTSERETFSMVTAESLCCGTPIVGFRAGGPESFALKDFSSFCEFGDIITLEKLILEYLNKDFNNEYISNLAVQKYSKEKMIADYLQIYNSMKTTNII